MTDKQRLARLEQDLYALARYVRERDAGAKPQDLYMTSVIDEIARGHAPKRKGQHPR